MAISYPPLTMCTVGDYYLFSIHTGVTHASKISKVFINKIRGSFRDTLSRHSQVVESHRKIQNIYRKIQEIAGGKG